MAATPAGVPRFLFYVEEFFRNHWAGITTRMRSRYWRHMLARAGSDFIVTGGAIRVRHPYNVEVGREVIFSEGVYINARDRVSIGDHVRLSAFVKINTGALNLDVPPDTRMKGEHTSAPVRIGNYVWLATGVMVNAGVTIHDGVVVGAGAIVTKDLPAYTLCVGIPAKPIRDLPRPAIYMKP